MARKPSERRNFQDEDTELNLTPMMNLISILIPLLLASMAFVQIAVLKISAPQISSSADPSPKKDDAEKPLNLVVVISEKGYLIKGNTQIGEVNYGAAGVNIPLTEKQLTCSKFVGTVPPPRKKNLNLGVCTEETAGSTRTFTVYDVDKLQTALREIKKQHAKEDKVTVTPGDAVEFEAMVDVMDASREYKEEGSETQVLFPTVVMGAGIGT